MSTLRNAVALVVLKEGKRISWKCAANDFVTEKSIAAGLGARYFGGHHPSSCELVTCRLLVGPNMDECETWAASFPAHPDEKGVVPKAR